MIIVIVLLFLLIMNYDHCYYLPRKSGFWGEQKAEVRAYGEVLICRAKASSLDLEPACSGFKESIRT